MQSLMSFIKTLFPEIPSEDVQQVMGANHTFFHIARMESPESYGMVPDDTKERSLKMSWAKISAK
jgi:hypothetical protein